MIDVQQHNLFDYASLDTDTRAFVQEKTWANQAKFKRMSNDAIEVGQNLLDIKEALEKDNGNRPGLFMDYLKSYFPLDIRTAERWMKYAERFWGTPIDKMSVPLTVLTELLNSDETIIEMIVSGQLPATVSAIRAKRTEEREAQDVPASSTLPPTWGLVDEKPFTAPLPDGKSVEIPDSWKLPPPVHTSNTNELSRVIDTEEEEEMPIVSTVLPQMREIHPILNTLTSKSNEWYTPQRYIEAARLLMGTIDLDPASCELANQTVKATRYFSQEDNGLLQEWHGTVWLNPPYGRDEAGSNQDVWSRRLIEQYRAGVTTEAILLVNASVDTKWFQRLFEFPVCFPDHRINFYSPDSSLSGSTHGSAFVYLGSQFERFFEIFSEFGTVVKRW